MLNAPVTGEYNSYVFFITGYIESLIVLATLLLALKEPKYLIADKAVGAN